MNVTQKPEFAQTNEYQNTRSKGALAGLRICFYF